MTFEIDPASARRSPRRCWPPTSAPTAFAQAKEQFFPALVYRTGAYAPNGVPFANGYVDYLKLVNAQGGINGVKVVVRGVRNRLCHRQGRRVLRASERQERRRDAVPAAVDRDHVRADREGAGRQDPAHHGRLRPQRERGRQRLQVELPARRHLLGRRRRPGPVPRQEGRRVRQAEGQEDHPRLSRQPVRQGTDPAAAGAGQDARLRVQLDSGDASGRRAEGGLAADPPEPSRLRAAVGLGRDELDRDQGGGRDRLPARQDVRRLVGRRRARRQGRRRRRQGLQRPGAAARRRAELQDRQGRADAGPRQGSRHRTRRRRSGRCCTCAG